MQGQKGPAPLKMPGKLGRNPVPHHHKKEFMDEVENQGVQQEVIAEPPTESQQDAQQQPKPVEDRQERNWRELRQRKNELEQESKRKDEIIATLLNKQGSQQSQIPTIDELDQISEEDFLPKGKNRKLIQKEVAPIEQKLNELDRKLEEYKRLEQFNSLKRRFNDFDDVVNPETLAILEEQEPELANTIAELKDPYKIGLQSYKYIKTLGIVDKAPDVRRAKEVEKRIEKNEKIIQSPLVNDKRPIAQAFDMGRMSEAEKSKLYQEMMHFAGMAGGY